jgi:hypothetical protein
MSIVSVSIVSDGGSPRQIVYSALDSEGASHRYGPVITSDPAFDADAFKTIVSAKVAAALAETEAEALLRGD